MENSFPFLFIFFIFMYDNSRVVGQSHFQTPACVYAVTRYLAIVNYCLFIDRMVAHTYIHMYIGLVCTMDRTFVKYVFMNVYDSPAI